MRLACLFILTMASLFATAQEQQKPLRKFVVADIETRVPIRNAVVMTKDGYRDTTNYRGICHIPETFDTLTVYKANYLTERLLLKETKDSTFLIPNNKRISEVTVWGKDQATRLQENAEKWTRQQPGMPNPGNGGISIGFDLASMLDKRRRKDLKNLQKTRQIFQKIDKLDDDPIVNAYKMEMKKRQLETENAKKQEKQKVRIEKDSRQVMEEKKLQTEETGLQTE